MPYLVLKNRESTSNKNGRKFKYKHKTVRNNDGISAFFINKIVKNADLATADKGLYTWILRSSGSIYAAKTVTKQEVGTLHVNLKMLTEAKDPSEIVAAGELELSSGPFVMFNLLSGTYMADKFKKLSNSQKLIYRNELKDTVMRVLEGFGIASQFLECSNVSQCSDEEKIGGMKLIETADIRTNNANLSNLNRFFNRVYEGGTRRRVIKKTRKNRK
jgi:hypothetical protein